MRCARCGKENSEDVIFCEHCGRNLVFWWRVKSAVVFAFVFLICGAIWHALRFEIVEAIFGTILGMIGAAVLVAFTGGHIRFAIVGPIWFWVPGVISLLLSNAIEGVVWDAIAGVIFSAIGGAVLGVTAGGREGLINGAVGVAIGFLIASAIITNAIWVIIGNAIVGTVLGLFLGEVIAKAESQALNKTQKEMVREE